MDKGQKPSNTKSDLQVQQGNLGSDFVSIPNKNLEQLSQMISKRK
jgi:hypothetical protein